MTEKMTPLETVKAYCAHCLGMPQHNADEIRNCQGDQAYPGPCPFFPYRMGKRTPVRVFRAFYLQCMGGNREFVRECQTVSCPVHPYRFGKNPAKKGQGASKETMKKARQSKKGRLESIFTREPIGEPAL